MCTTPIPKKERSRQASTYAPIYEYTVGDAVAVYYGGVKHSGVIKSRIADTTKYNIQFGWGTAAAEVGKIWKFPTL